MFVILLRLDVTVALLSLPSCRFCTLMRYYMSTLINREERVKELESKLRRAAVRDVLARSGWSRASRASATRLRRYTQAGDRRR